MQISITKNPNPGTMPPENELGFGKVFTDHLRSGTTLESYLTALYR